MKLEEMENRIKELESHLTKARDIQEIEKLQRIYGYYLEHWMAQEIIDLFSDGPDVALEWPEGSYLGKEGVSRYFRGMERRDPEFMHQLMQVSGVIDIAADGKTALGRWYSFGGVSVPRGGGVNQSFVSGTYENEYVKENGKWKIKRIRWHLNFKAVPGPNEGWVRPERLAAYDVNAKSTGLKPDVPDNRYALAYPSGHIFPFHFKHPITDKKTTEDQMNEERKKS